MKKFGRLTDTGKLDGVKFKYSVRLSILTAQDMLGCDAEQQLCNAGTVGGTSENANLYDTLNFAIVLKKVCCPTSI